MTFPDLRPRAGEAAEILARAKRRRAARTATTGGLALAAVVGVLVLPGLAGGAMADRADLVNPPVPTPSELPLPLPSLVLPGPTGPSGTPTTESQPSEEPAGEPDSSPRSYPVGPDAESPEKPTMRRQKLSGYPLACKDPLEERPVRTLPDGFCAMAWVWSQDGYDTLSLQVCRAHDAADTRALSFPRGLESDFRVLDQGAVAWTWSTGSTWDESPHTEPMAPSDCLSWSVAWTGTDETGVPVPDGTYVMEAEAFAPELGEGARFQIEFRHTEEA